MLRAPRRRIGTSTAHDVRIAAGVSTPGPRSEPCRPDRPRAARRPPKPRRAERQPDERGAARCAEDFCTVPHSGEAPGDIRGTIGGASTRVGPRATENREPRQDRKGATVSGHSRVPQVTWPSSRLLFVGGTCRNSPPPCSPVWAARSSFWAATISSSPAPRLRARRARRWAPTTGCWAAAVPSRRRSALDDLEDGARRGRARDSPRPDGTASRRWKRSRRARRRASGSCATTPSRRRLRPVVRARAAQRATATASCSRASTRAKRPARTAKPSTKFQTSQEASAEELAAIAKARAAAIVTNNAFLIKIIPPRRLQRLPAARAAAPAIAALVVGFVAADRRGALGLHAWQLHLPKKTSRRCRQQAAAQQREAPGDRRTGRLARRRAARHPAPRRGDPPLLGVAPAPATPASDAAVVAARASRRPSTASQARLARLIARLRARLSEGAASTGWRMRVLNLRRAARRSPASA